MIICNALYALDNLESDNQILLNFIEGNIFAHSMCKKFNLSLYVYQNHSDKE